MKERKEYKVRVNFVAGCYGSFSQKVIFDFGCRPVVGKDLIVDVATEDMLDDIKDIRETLSIGIIIIIIIVDFCKCLYYILLASVNNSSYILSCSSYFVKFK